VHLQRIYIVDQVLKNTVAERRNIMAKGQQRSNKEAKKPKQQKPPSAPVGAFITQPKQNVQHKTKH
jgi:hypothetical protein